jgi:Domain of unknown function (DUF5063)
VNNPGQLQGTQQIDDATKRFVASSERYLQWVNNPALQPTEDVRVARLLLLEIHYQVLLLPEITQIRDVTGVRPDDSYQAYFEYRFQSLPVRYYAFTFDPFANPPEQPLVGDVAEDLTLIYLDLYEGLSLYHGGHPPEAVWTWKTSFKKFWGRHLINSLNAIHHFVSTVNGL